MSIFLFMGETFMLKRISDLLGKKAVQDEQHTESIQPEKIPQHIAIIMDGNGRWAKLRNLPRIAGHRAGMTAVKEIVRAADEIGVKVLTLYAFSTENWKRPREEVDFLMKLPQEFLSTELDELVERNVKINMIGSKEGLPQHTLRALEAGEEKTRNNTGLQLNFALNYGSRKELVSAIADIAQDILAGKISADSVDEELLNRYLYTSEFPDPDLLIRTSGEIRLSNFMLWQLAYTELWFTDVLWPDFTKEKFYEAIAEYQGRARRYGAV